MVKWSGSKCNILICVIKLIQLKFTFPIDPHLVENAAGESLCQHNPAQEQQSSSQGKKTLITTLLIHRFI